MFSIHFIIICGNVHQSEKILFSLQLHTQGNLAIANLMKLIAITQQDLKSINKLAKNQSSLSGLLKQLNTRLDRIERAIGQKVSAPSGGARKTIRTRIPLDTKIPQALKQAGKKGIRIPELAAKIDAHLPSVRVWFSKNTKSHKNVKRIGRGTYQWVK